MSWHSKAIEKIRFRREKRVKISTDSMVLLGLLTFWKVMNANFSDRGGEPRSRSNNRDVCIIVIEWEIKMACLLP